MKVQEEYPRQLLAMGNEIGSLAAQGLTAKHKQFQTGAPESYQVLKCHYGNEAQIISAASFEKIRHSDISLKLVVASVIMSLLS